MATKKTVASKAEDAVASAIENIDAKELHIGMIDPEKLKFESTASGTIQIDTELEAILSKPDLQDWAHGLAKALHAKFGVIPKAIDFNPKMGRIRIIGVDNSGRGARVEPVNFDEDADE